MYSAIKSPDNPLFPPAANRLWVSDGWHNSLGTAPQFAYKLQNVVVDGEGNETVTDLNYNNVSMTDKQWQGWTNQPDEDYILACVSEVLGLSPA